MFTKKYICSIASIAIGVCLLSTSAFANTVNYQSNKPLKVIYQIAHRNTDQAVVLGDQHIATVNGFLAIPIKMEKYKEAGIVTDSINGHKLPPRAKLFGKLKTCTASTNKNKQQGVINITETAHTISCSH